jgi:hypothetical protein
MRGSDTKIARPRGIARPLRRFSSTRVAAARPCASDLNTRLWSVGEFGEHHLTGAGA